MRKATACMECGAVLGGPRETARFCCTPCRQRFNNRRLTRGAELYDLLMAHNYDRHIARPLKLWSLVYRLLAAYRDADRASRAGRASWRPVKEAVAAVPMAFGAGGDGR